MIARLLADALFVAGVLSLAAWPTGVLANWLPTRQPDRCDTCGSRHNGDCPATAPAVTR